MTYRQLIMKILESSVDLNSTAQVTIWGRKDSPVNAVRNKQQGEVTFFVGEAGDGIIVENEDIFLIMQNGKPISKIKN